MLSVSCRQSDDVNRTMDKIIDPYRFSIVQWEINALTGELEQALFERSSYTIYDSLVVVDFFKLVEEISGLEFQISYYKDQIDEEDMTILENRLVDLRQQRDSLKKGVEKILSLQIRETLKQLDLYLYNDITGIDITFPPINFSLESPPNLLIVSPRDSIYRMKEVILLQDLTQDEIDYIETEIDKLGYSSIVLRVGGMATFPSFVTNNAGLEFTISTAVEEWFHQYFFFEPAGFLYAFNLLGLYDDNDISTINETIAGIVSDEIASMVYQDYYAAYYEKDVSAYEEDTSADSDDSGFDFYEEMRNIRIAVDNYLAAGEVEQAEAYMEEKRLYILSQGYYIRRLNQAYFAFYGTYASSPSSVNPIGEMLRDLRENSLSVTDFIKITSGIKNLDDLNKLSDYIN
jgi:hypothetical protein